MRKNIAIICCLMLLMLLLPACAKENDKTVTIIFVQDGQQNITRTVNKGESLTDIPEVVKKDGYTIVWEETDFSSINSSITVNAVITPNQYRIFYDANGGTVENSEQIVTFDGEFELFVPVRTNAVFQGWYIVGSNATTAFSAGKYTIVGDVYLKAKWTATGAGGEWSENG